MFTEELKAFRRLGFRHVRSFSVSKSLTNPSWIGPVTGVELCLSDCVWLDDLERTGFNNQHRVSHRSGTEVRSAIIEAVGLWANSVSSGSMEPAFYRGDLLFLTNPPLERYHTGDITVYKIPGADIPIVHRVMETHDVASPMKISGSVHFYPPSHLFSFSMNNLQSGFETCWRSITTDKRRQ